MPTRPDSANSRFIASASLPDATRQRRHVADFAHIKPAAEPLTGKRLAAILRNSDAVGKMYLAQQIATGRIVVTDFTPLQICRLCDVPVAYRGRVLEGR